MTNKLKTENQLSKEGRPDYGPPVKVIVSVQIEALAFAEPEGGYSVLVPALPGCVTQGDDIEEVKRNVVEAAEGWLAVKHDLEVEAGNGEIP
jgi:predicted RNase H-like HicB family nuclease